MNKLGKIVLWVAGVIFIGIGVLYMLTPTMLRPEGLSLGAAPARTEIRAVYGGIELGLGIFFILCARCDAWLRGGLYAAALTSGGAGIGRIVGWLSEGTIDTPNLIYGVLELGGAVLAAWIASQKKS